MRYRKKPVVVEAVQLTTDNVFDLARWCGGWVVQPGNPGFSQAAIGMCTNHGPAEARSGDWIIKSPEGEFYPCNYSVLEATYEPVEDE